MWRIRGCTAVPQLLTCWLLACLLCLRMRWSGHLVWHVSLRLRILGQLARISALRWLLSLLLID